jgi:hypothetical protein
MPAIRRMIAFCPKGCSAIALSAAKAAWPPSRTGSQVDRSSTQTSPDCAYTPVELM